MVVILSYFQYLKQLLGYQKVSSTFHTYNIGSHIWTLKLSNKKLSQLGIPTVIAVAP